jgi:hypothetical protein
MLKRPLGYTATDIYNVHNFHIIFTFFTLHIYHAIQYCNMGASGAPLSRKVWDIYGLHNIPHGTDRNSLKSLARKFLCVFQYDIMSVSCNSFCVCHVSVILIS